MRYFVAANFWLFIAVVVAMEKTYVRYVPDRCTFFGVGTWFSPFAYNLLNFCLLAVSVFFFILSRNQD